MQDFDEVAWNETYGYLDPDEFRYDESKISVSPGFSEICIPAEVIRQELQDDHDMILATTDYRAISGLEYLVGGFL
jgi:hypothetical protein